MPKDKLDPKDYPKKTAHPDHEIRLIRGAEVLWNVAEGGPVAVDEEYDKRLAAEEKAREEKAKKDKPAKAEAAKADTPKAEG